MFGEREEHDLNMRRNDRDRPFITNLHSGSSNKSPYEWIVDNGMRNNFSINKIKFFFCAKHENSGKIESHLWFFKGFCSY